MENNCKDPIECFLHIPHIIDNILNHLSVYDLLNVATVNSAYYKFVVESKIYGNKVKLKVTESNFDVVSSERCYKNIKLSSLSNCHQILDKFSDIKYLEIEGEGFSTAKFRSIIEAFTSLDELILSDLKFKDLNLSEIENLKNLSNLKSIQIKAIHEELVHPLLVQCPNLKRLSIKNLSRKAPIDEILKLLSDKVQFQLEEFEFSDYGYYNFCQQKLGLLSFLERSFGTMKVLVFDVWLGILPLKLVFQMPHLEKLRLYEVAHADRTIAWDEIDIPQNHTLKYLSIQDYSHKEKLLACVLKAAPKIRILEVYSLSNNDILEISTHCLQLGELHAYFLDINNSVLQQNLLKSLHRFVVAVGDDLRQTIMTRSEAERSHLEKLLLAN